MYAYLGATCHLHFWQNDRGLLRATVVTRGVERTPKKSQHRNLTLEKKILLLLLPGLELATFRLVCFQLVGITDGTSHIVRQLTFRYPLTDR